MSRLLRALPVLLLLAFGGGLAGCLDNEDHCEGIKDPGGSPCTTDRECGYTCVCQDGNADGGGCQDGICESATGSCYRICHQSGLGYFTGQVCVYD